jgi:hypothetical protein
MSIAARLGGKFNAPVLDYPVQQALAVFLLRWVF